MTTYNFDTQDVPAGVEAKITDIRGQEVFNSLSPEVVKELKDDGTMVSTIIEARPSAYQHPKTGEIVDENGDPISENRAKTIGYIHALNPKIANEIFKRLRITKK